MTSPPKGAQLIAMNDIDRRSARDIARQLRDLKDEIHKLSWGENAQWVSLSDSLRHTHRAEKTRWREAAGDVDQAIKRLESARPS
jgi:hypothetical protein